MQLTTAAVSLALSLAGLVWLARRGGPRNSIVLVAGFFVYFAFGPVVNLLRGDQVYFGTVLAEVPAAAVGFAVAVAGMCAADLLMRQRATFDRAAPRTLTRIYVVLPIVYLVLALYGAAVLAMSAPALLAAGTKTSAIAIAGPFHYQYLLLQLAVVSTFHISRQTRLQTVLWNANFAVYLTYCLVTSERDFLFVVAALLVHREIVNNQTRGWRIIVLAVAGLLLGSWLFAYRASTETDLAAVLNQGSVLFVDSYVHSWVPQTMPFELGGTYLSSALGALPLLGVESTPLSQWLQSTYAPGGTSGYGFSMTGEAYFNFGYLGVFAVMLLAGLAQRYAINRADRSDWWGYAGIYLTIVWLYAIRGDSTQVFSSLTYGALFFVLLRLASVGTAHAGGLIEPKRDQVAQALELRQRK